jgi:hypothetical protein|tara:strand:+ start:2075 stop:2317 length:243 start_codon:yes stop_codon:yes gene_type:complete
MGIVIDINKARVITKDRLRGEREPLLKTLDIQFMQAQEAGSPTSDIVAKKQQLRDAPSQVDSMNTVDELKAATLPDVGLA